MQKLITTLFFLIAAIAVFFSWTQPYIDGIKVLSQEEQELNEILLNSRNLQERRDEILGVYNTINQNDIFRLNKLLPEQMRAIDMVIEIENIVKGHGLLFKNIGIAAPAKEKNIFGLMKKDFETVPLTMVVSGPYNSFVSFLEDLEKSLYLIDINQLTFSSGKVDSYEFTIRANTYWKR
jgi:Tfp pilus assembly protein PilO